MQKNNKQSKLLLLPQNSSFFPLSLTQIRTQQLKNFMRQKLTKIGSLELKKKLCSHLTMELVYYILQLSLSIFTQKYLLNCKDTYFILQNKFLRIYEDIFGIWSKDN